MLAIVVIIFSLAPREPAVKPANESAVEPVGSQQGRRFVVSLHSRLTRAPVQLTLAARADLLNLLPLASFDSSNSCACQFARYRRVDRL